MTAITTTTDIIRAAETYRVYLRWRWADPWVEEPFLQCLWVSWSASPKVSAAEFQWIYGRGMRQGETAFADVEPRAILDWYVKVEIDQPNDADGNAVLPLKWHGLIQEDGDNPRGARIGQDSAGESRVAIGRQALLAYGLEVLLDLEPVTTSFVETTEGAEAKPTGRGLTFNEENHNRPASGLDKKHHYKMPGNRSKELASRGTYVFAKDAADAEIWTIRQIVSYLVRYHTPSDGMGNDAVPFRMDGIRRLCLPDWGRPKLASHGRTTKHLLDELMDRRRLLGWTVAVEADYFGAGQDAVLVRPFTFIDADLTLPYSEDPDLSGRTLDANPEQVALDFDAAVDVAAVHLKESSVDLYDQAVATGGRIVCCGTISGIEETLVAHWSAAEQTEYNAGASGAADYAALDPYAKEERNKVARACKRLERVYSYFGLPSDWDGWVGDGETGVESQLFPFTELELVAAVNMAFYAPEMRFLSTIPLKTNHDYTGDLIATDQVADNTPAGYAWENRPVYVLLKLADNPSLGAGVRYAEIDKMAAAADVELCGAGDGRTFSCSVRVQEHGPGVVLRVSGGQGQHSIASMEFVSPGGIDEDPGEFDWFDNLVVTFAIEADRSVEMAWPKTVATQWDFQRILRIDASARCGLHYVAPGTVVECKDGILQRTTGGGFVRDDRPLLKMLAHTAYQWYATPRQAFTFVFRQASGLLKVGQLITTIGSGDTLEAVRSVVTQVRIDLAHSDNETHRTTVETQWAELDVMKLLT